MFKITLPTAIIDRNFTRAPTTVNINNAHYQYTVNGTCIEISSSNMALPTYLLEQGFEFKISSTPETPTKTYQDLLDDIMDYRCTIDQLEGSLLHYKDQLEAIRKCLV